ncbi:MAG TPA: Mov34/MPN/PAD-1 family protein [Candidatus Thermoplasmatota archaeon]|nr:Mov34/MPN/PAD-1 family protein [Candidatus Thermoplasmatota archaeon]
MGLFDKSHTPASRDITHIDRAVLETIFEVSRDSHPDEFAATLRAEGESIVELLIVPGAQGGERSAILPLHMLPIDPDVVGTVHSHPGPSAMPSDADLALFRKFGHTHIIVHEPYNEKTWRVYDHAGRPRRLAVR